MHIKIKFDNANPDWQKDESLRKFYIRARFAQLMDRYKFDGYLYFSTIHDYFNLVWDPYNENKCFIYERDKDLKIDISDSEAGEYLIDICGLLAYGHWFRMGLAFEKEGTFTTKTVQNLTKLFKPMSKK